MLKKINKQNVETLDLSNGQYDSIILANYFGIHALPILINSPLRKEQHPSFGFQYYGDRILWKDFSTGEKGNIVQLLQKIWQLPYNQTTERIASDILSNNIKIIDVDFTKRYKYHSQQKVIRIHSIPFEQKHIDYWKKYGINKKQLEFAGVIPIDYFSINDNLLKADSIAFAYSEKDNATIKYKIYQPYNKKYKWINGLGSRIISLYNKIPYKGNHLIIASSMKDALCIWCNTRIPSIAFQSEVQTITSDIINELKSRYKNVYICYDNDDVGMHQASEKSEKFNLTNIIIPQFEGGKDISDYYKYNPELMKSLIEKHIIKNDSE